MLRPPRMEPTTVYLDNAASTRPADEVVQATNDAATRWFGNPSSAHSHGAAAARALEEARAAVLAALGTDTGQVIFTGGGTEANALGVLGAAAVARGRHIIASAIEHPAVLRNAEKLAVERAFE